MNLPEPDGLSFQRRMASARSLILLLDYDGTLAPITAHPSKAVLPQQTKRVLEQLTRQPGVRVVLVSGRALDELRPMVGLPGLCYVGNHGLELQDHGYRYVNPRARASRPLLAQIAQRSQSALRHIPGAWVEDKGLTVSLHWRSVPASARQTFQRTVEQLTAGDLTKRRIRVTHGKRVIELRPPVPWGKGQVVAWIRRRVEESPQRARPLLVYFGDDQTDEDAFRAVNRHRGISVFVGSRPRATVARWRVRNPREVGNVLRRILQARWKSARTR